MLAIDVPDVHYVRNEGAALAYQLFGSGPIELVYAPPWINNLEVAWAIGERFPDQDFSIVDRTSFAVMERLGVRRVAAFDSDFLPESEDFLSSEDEDEDEPPSPASLTSRERLRVP